jgi:hypothetical protein
MQICYISNGIIPHICSDCLGNTAELSKEQKIMQSELIIFFEHISLFFWLIRKKKAKSLWGKKKKRAFFSNHGSKASSYMICKYIQQYFIRVHIGFIKILTKKKQMQIQLSSTSEKSF